MNFLQLCQRTYTECGEAGTFATTQNQSGNVQRIINWVGTAWTELQTKHPDWHFMRSSALNGGGVTFVPAAGVPVTPFGTGPGTLGIQFSDLGMWALGTFRNYITASGTANEVFMDNLASYDEWRNGYMYGALRSVQTRPMVIAAAPDQKLCVGPPSNGLYTVYGDYFMAPTSMAQDTDVPTNLPVHFHMILVYDAMRSYADYEAAPEVGSRGEKNYRKLLAQLEKLRLAEIVAGRALA